MAGLRTRWLWLWTATITVATIAVLGVNFILVGISFLSWGAATVLALVLCGLLGVFFGWLNHDRPYGALWSVAWISAGSIFVLIVLQYLVAAFILPACDYPNQANCFEDHSAAMGGLAATVACAALGGFLGLSAISATALRRRLGQRSA
ncbi:MAG: hypothetical protein ABI289_02795 [Candidatus Dormibacter sp.]